MVRGWNSRKVRSHNNKQNQQRLIHSNIKIELCLMGHATINFVSNPAAACKGEHHLVESHCFCTSHCIHSTGQAERGLKTTQLWNSLGNSPIFQASRSQQCRLHSVILAPLGMTWVCWPLPTHLFPELGLLDSNHERSRCPHPLTHHDDAVEQQGRREHKRDEHALAVEVLLAGEGLPMPCS